MAKSLCPSGFASNGVCVAQNVVQELPRYDCLANSPAPPPLPSLYPRTSHRARTAPPHERKDRITHGNRRLCPDGLRRQCSRGVGKMDCFLQRHATGAGDCERPREGVSCTHGVHGSDLWWSDIQDSSCCDGERGIAASGDDHLPAMRGGACALRFGLDLGGRHGNERGRLLRIEDERVHFHSGLDELGSQRRRITGTPTTVAGQIRQK